MDVLRAAIDGAARQQQPELWSVIVVAGPAGDAPGWDRLIIFCDSDWAGDPLGPLPNLQTY